MLQIAFFLCSLLAHPIPPFEGCKRCIKHYSTKSIAPYINAYKRYHYDYSKNSTYRIPKKIHQIWFGGPLPENFKLLAQSWKEHHPDWEYFLWTDQDIDTFLFVTGDQIKKTQNLGQRADIFRLEVLNRFGGLYVDTDFVCVKPHDCFHQSADFYAGMENSNVSNALIGTTPNHPLIKIALHQISKIRNFDPNYDRIQETTGPKFFTRCVNQYIATAKDRTIIYPCKYFYPIHCSQRHHIWNATHSVNFLNQCIKPQTHSIHLWATSWTNDSQSKTLDITELLPQSKKSL